MSRRKPESGYPAFGSIPRLHRDVTITEKIDGTNGLISIEEVDADEAAFQEAVASDDSVVVHQVDRFYVVKAGSRNRWLRRGADNYGFCQWVFNNSTLLASDLGPGLHYGEWFGKGIQHGYGLTEKYFALFNSHRWEDAEFITPNLTVVPVLATTTGHNLNRRVQEWLAALDAHGSAVANRLGVQTKVKAEGVIVYHSASGHYYKATVENDATPKSLVRAA
jgi:hypothetical protein